MKNIIFVLICLMQIHLFAQEKKVYVRGGQKIDVSLIDENVGDSIRINKIFQFKNDTKSTFIKILNLEGKTYAQGISEYVILDFNSKKGGDLHRKVENLTNIKIENGKFSSDQLKKLSFVYLKEKEVNYGKSKPPIKIMMCSTGKNNVTTCRINDDDVDITPEEFAGKYPQTAFIRLGYDDLKDKKPKELSLMRKEILARYGYRFSEESDAKYFFSQNWYEPIVDNKLIELNDLEKDNMSMISLFEGNFQYKNLNKSSYGHIFPIETSSQTLYDASSLKSVKYMKQDSVVGSKCTFTEYNKKGIAIAKQNCMINEYQYVNYFKNEMVVQNIDQLNDTFFYYQENGLPYKTVKLDYKVGTTEECLYTYDSEDNVIKKEVYQNNDYNSTVYYDYDSEGNLVKEYFKDEKGNEQMPIEYFYDSDNVNIGFLRNNDIECEYSFNDQKDIITETQCFKKVNGEKLLRSKTIRNVLETLRGKQRKVISFKLSEVENNRYGYSVTEIKYY
ncbi:YARHG domain-containing protein [Apibacter raozihei]|uniref:YARHG domain-containing protein n=1 Tax=Apibacter raozihei TaxID=2500547 RepID=UPI000FE40205|nr:YARHG domain-containing protein [Apibacter raozihei]